MKSRIDASRQARTPTAIVTCPDCGEKIVLKGIIHVGLRERNIELGLKERDGHRLASTETNL